MWNPFKKAKEKVYPKGLEIFSDGNLFILVYDSGYPIYTTEKLPIRIFDNYQDRIPKFRSINSALEFFEKWYKKRIAIEQENKERQERQENPIKSFKKVFP